MVGDSHSTSDKRHRSNYKLQAKLMKDSTNEAPWRYLSVSITGPGIDEKLVGADPQ